MISDATTTHETPSANAPATGTRRGTLAALLAGSALGLTALGHTPAARAAKEKKGKKHRGGKDRKSSKGEKGNKGNKGGGNAGAALPSIRYVYKTTTFHDSGIGTAAATCPVGYLPVGAGISSSIPDPFILSSLPHLERNSWEFELDGVEPQLQATVTAICLAATDDTTVDDTENRSALHRRSKRGRKRKT